MSGAKKEALDPQLQASATKKRIFEFERKSVPLKYGLAIEKGHFVPYSESVDPNKRALCPENGSLVL